MGDWRNCEVIPPGREWLGFRCKLPSEWVQPPIPEDEPDFSAPTSFLPLMIAMAPYGLVVFTIAARPGFDDGSVEEWARYLAEATEVEIGTCREARIGRSPCILIEATQASDAGLMQVMSVFLEDGGRLYNLGAMAPQAIWPSVEATFREMFAAFELVEMKGLTAQPMRLMTSDPVVNLSEWAAPILAPEPPEPEPIQQPITEPDDDPRGAANPAPSSLDRATQPADVALADDPSSVDPEHEMNVRLRDAGAGLVPRIIMTSHAAKFVTVGAGAVVGCFRVPFGWHVIDDGKRTLVFDAPGKMQLSLSLRPAEANSYDALLKGILRELAEANEGLEYVCYETEDVKAMGIRNLVINGERLVQTYLVRESNVKDMALVCRVTSTEEDHEFATDTAEVIFTSYQLPAPPEEESEPHRPVPPREYTDEKASSSDADSGPRHPVKERKPDLRNADGEPLWWVDALVLERENRLEQAEQVILDSLDHIGVYSSLAYMYELRLERMRSEGNEEGAREAKKRAIHWLTVYASSATSGGEGTALSYERRRRIEAMGGED